MTQQSAMVSIHQFSPSCGTGDGISNGMFFTRDLLRELGYLSEIFCELISADLQDEVKQINSGELLKLTGNDLLLVHHSLGYENDVWIQQIQAKKVLVYHNITPPQYLPNNELPALSTLGRKQLRSWSSDYLGAIGDSEFNSEELLTAGYSNVKTIPLLVDIERIYATACNTNYLKQWESSYNILFVGRFCEHKKQLELIRMFQHLKQFVTTEIKLILVGGVTSDAYLSQIKEYVIEHGLQEQVIITGKVTDEQLAALYRSADVYVSLSEHEGFGMPLLEAMLYDIPVIAKEYAAIAATLGVGGILLSEESSIEDVAANIYLLMTEPNLRRQIRLNQRENCERFKREHIQLVLSTYLESIGISNPLKIPKKDNKNIQFQIEGPFDSSYSLAIVNRELAHAIEVAGHPISLRSKEGFGDFEPSSQFLTAHPSIRSMVENYQNKQVRPEYVLRNCYPPVLHDMQGCMRVINSYGWEESGFPSSYVQEFNLKLDLVTVVSQFVKKVLRDNGIRIPIAVVGNGVDHLLHLQTEKLPENLTKNWKKFRFLHISSCFPRKGVDALLVAYGKAFTIHDDVTLIIKTFTNPHNDVELQLKELKSQDLNFPHVEIINEDYSDAFIKGLYDVCHAVVAPSRGEGFGLPIAEAMVFNLPVIATQWSGQLDFVNENNAWLCDFEFSSSNSHFQGLHSVWANPNVEHLSQLMKELVTSSIETIQKKTILARKNVMEHFKWSDVAERTLAAISQLQKQTKLMQAPNVAWVSTWNARCGVASYSSFLTSQIPSQRLTILANYTAERTQKDADNVKRCWNASVIEDMEYAFETIIDAECKLVVIQYNFGFFSLDTLSVLIHKLKQHNVSVHIFFHATADVMWGEQKVSLELIAKDLQMADRLYVHSVDDLNRLKKIGLVNNVVYFPQGLMPTLPFVNDSKIQSVKKKIIASYGFLLPHKGIQALIKAFIILAEKDQNLHLMLVNSLYPVAESENELHQCNALVAQANLSHRVSVFSDYLADEESQALLQKADLIIYPYQKTQESSSAAVRMGLAARRPIAVTPLSIFDDVKDVVHYLPGTSPEEIAQGISMLINNQQLLNEKEANATAWVNARQWPLLSQRLLNIMDGLTNEEGVIH